MREIDLLLLEEINMRRNVETNRTAVVAQTVCLMAVGLFFFAAFFYALTHRDPTHASASNQLSHSEIGSLPGYPGIPQP
jgi:hypothetical protein